jgi:hypothetical protein
LSLAILERRTGDPWLTGGCGNDADQPGVESWQIGRLSTRDQVRVLNNLLIGPATTGIRDIRAEAGPGGEVAVPDRIRLDQQPGCVTDCADGLPRREEVPNELDRPRIGPEGVGVGDPAGQDQGIVIAALDLGNNPVNLKSIALIEMVESLNLARLERDEIDLGTRLLQRTPWFDQLNLLHSISRKHGDFVVVQLLVHATLLGAWAQLQG